MKKYFLTRLALALPVILLVSVFSFALVFLAPGDPAAQYRTLEMTDEEYEQLKTELGYNDPVIVQYGRWLGKVLQGDFGVSTSSHTGVWPLIKAKLPATVGLMAASIVFSLLVSIPLGMLAGYFENSWFDRITNGLHYVAISIPSFWFAIMLIILFSLNLGWLPSSGMRTTGVHTFWDLSRHAIMPVLVLSIGKISIYARYVRLYPAGPCAEELPAAGHHTGGHESRQSGVRCLHRRDHLRLAGTGYHWHERHLLP